MIKKITSGGLKVIIGQFSVLITSLIYYYLLVSSLDDHNLGEFYSVISLITFIHQIASSGLGSFLILNMDEKGMPNYKAKSIQVLSIIIVQLLALVIIPLYIYFLKIKLNIITILFCTEQPVFMLFVTIFSASLQKEKKFAQYSLSRIALGASKVLSFIFLIKITKPVEAALIASSTSFLFSSIFFIKSIINSLRLSPNFYFPDQKKSYYLKESIRNFSNFYLIALLTNSDFALIVFISSFFISKDVIGITSAINTFPQNLWMIFSAIVIVTYPMMTDLQSVKNLLSRSFMILIIFAIPLFTILNFGLNYVFVLAKIEDRFENYTIILIFLSLGWLLKLFTDLIQNSLLVLSKFKRIYISYGFSIIIAICSLLFTSLIDEKISLFFSFSILYIILFTIYSIFFINLSQPKKYKIAHIRKILAVPIVYILSNSISFFINQYFLNYKINIFIKIIFVYSSIFFVSFILSLIFGFNSKERKLIYRKALNHINRFKIKK